MVKEPTPKANNRIVHRIGIRTASIFLVIRRLLHDTHAIVARQCGRIVGRRCFSGAFAGRVMVRVAVGVRTAVGGALARQKAET